MQTIQEILTKAGFDVSNMNNRQRAVKSLNSVFKNSKVEMEICNKDKVWVPKDGFKHNVVIKIRGIFRIRFKTNDFNTYNLLLLMGKFLSRDEVKKHINSETHLPYKCMKCEGAGTIPQFYYYAEGVCFDCLGVGMLGKLNVTIRKPSELKGARYLAQFRICKNYTEKFPKDVINHIKPINLIDHPTAVVMLSKKDDVYYIHQPICMSNTWYSIPENEFERFKVEYVKLYKLNEQF